MKTSLLIIALLFSITAIAGDSGMYFDSARNGEGIGLHRNGDRMAFFLYTYGEYGCENYHAPTVGPVIQGGDHCEVQGQRWFMGSGALVDDTEMEGFLYATFGLNYPEGIPQPDNPWANDVGEPIAVGFFTLRRWHEGWRLLVVPYGDYLPGDDVLYSRVFDFDTPLFFSED